MIQPTIGRKVWYRPGPQGDGGLNVWSDQPLDATVVYVHGDRLVNLVVFDHSGQYAERRSVTLVQEGDDIPHGHYAEWMPYQNAQAKKHEA